MIIKVWVSVDNCTKEDEFEINDSVFKGLDEEDKEKLIEKHTDEALSKMCKTGYRIDK